VPSAASRFADRVWRGYTSDTFFACAGGWRYLDECGAILGLASFCPHCDFQVYPQNDSPFRAVDRIACRCDGCGRELLAFDEPVASLAGRVERFIQQKLRNGTWAAGPDSSAVQPDRSASSALSAAPSTPRVAEVPFAAFPRDWT
jgi:hypothetical protein